MSQDKFDSELIFQFSDFALPFEILKHLRDRIDNEQEERSVNQDLRILLEEFLAVYQSPVDFKNTISDYLANPWKNFEWDLALKYDVNRVTLNCLKIESHRLKEKSNKQIERKKKSPDAKMKIKYLLSVYINSPTEYNPWILNENKRISKIRLKIRFKKDEKLIHPLSVPPILKFNSQLNFSGKQFQQRVLDLETNNFKSLFSKEIENNFFTYFFTDLSSSHLANLYQIACRNIWDEINPFFVPKIIKFYENLAGDKLPIYERIKSLETYASIRVEIEKISIELGEDFWLLLRQKDKTLGALVVFMEVFLSSFDNDPGVAEVLTYTDYGRFHQNQIEIIQKCDLDSKILVKRVYFPAYSVTDDLLSLSLRTFDEIGYLDYKIFKYQHKYNASPTSFNLGDVPSVLIPLVNILNSFNLKPTHSLLEYID
jgi:predicted DNA-binding protein YlxM (UPF0122 family)